ncbi:MAG: helix-turn-helix domain-containing protein, partial [Burkholderiaceae bacterium]
RRPRHTYSTDARATSARLETADTAAPAGSERIEQVLAQFDGNRAAAAEHLGISRTTLWRRLKSER